MYKVILIDDEPLARQLIASFLQAHADYTVVAECGDGFEGFKAIQQHQPDLIFLDIQMPRLNGFEMLELLDERPGVIFTTAFDEFAVKAFEAHAVDYLLKPVVRDRFEKALSRWQQQAAIAGASAVAPLLENNVYEGYQHRVVVKDNGLIRIIPAQEIHYIEADDDYVRIVTKNGTYLKKSTLGHIEQSLDPQQFVRVHRSFLVPVSQLMRIEPYEKESHIALLHCGAKVTVSKSGMARLKTLLGW
jgi:two-component system, LytTR family, response regulator